MNNDSKVQTEIIDSHSTEKKKDPVGDAWRFGVVTDLRGRYLRVAEVRVGVMDAVVIDIWTGNT